MPPPQLRASLPAAVGALVQALSAGGGHVGMSSPLAHQLLANYTVSDLEAGLGGSWFDNFGASLFNGKTSTACGLRCCRVRLGLGARA